MTVEAYTDAANTLNQVAAIDTSNRALGFNREKKTEILKQLRSQMETGRKLFNFALVNAANGIAAAAKVVEIGTSSMTPEEKKRFEALAPRKRQYENRSFANNYGNNGGQQQGAAAPSRNDILKALGLAPENSPASRAICYNCQKPGHYAKNCNEPPRIKPKPDV